MMVNLTKEQIEFLDYLCFSVEYDYEHYSPKEQEERETMASIIRCALEDAVDNNIDEDKLDELADEYAECEPTQNNYAAFIAGYRKAME